ncbi:MAG: polysulfide reductase NrfD [Ardenticatenaceae bacterium]|nr:polysulfide reductase NrfD [Ardenticatenaceae bacterium]
MAAIKPPFSFRRRFLGSTSFYVWIAILLAMIGVGVTGMYRTLTQGLQVTNLSDRVPWGLWITHDLSAIGLGAGAFTFSAVVYLFRIKRFEPIARTAVFVGFLGYTSAMLALAMDIGRPDRFWHPLVYWNVHSVLWEITWCVILYSTVLVIEVLPIVFDSKYFARWPKLAKFGHSLHKLTPVMAVLGMALSLLHQSSLGATYGVLSGRAIWFKPSMPVMFILSAVAGGVSLTLLVTMVLSKLTGKELIDKFLRRDIARLSAFALLAYLYLKVWDWAATNYYSHAPGTADAMARLQATTPYTQSFWWLEVVLCGVVPAVILLNRPFRRRHGVFMVGLALIVVGVVVNRWNVTLSGLVVPPSWSPGVLGNAIAATYTPSWTEVSVSLGVLGYALLAFTLGAKYLPLFTSSHAESGAHE